MSEQPPVRKLIIGLGNLGGSYEKTRHNLGFMVVDKLAQRRQLKFKPSSFVKGFTADFELKGMDVALLKPATYMNSSGVAVRQMIDHGKYSLENTLTICDDLNIEFQRIKLRPEGSDGGNNGLKSIIEKLNSVDFPRLRMGIGHPGHKDGVIDFVLEDFTPEEQEHLEPFIERAADCCEAWLTDGITQAMEQFNRR